MPKEGFVQTQWGKMDFNGLYINIYTALLYTIHNKYGFLYFFFPVLVNPGGSRIPSTHYFKYIVASQREIIATNYCAVAL